MVGHRRTRRGHRQPAHVSSPAATSAATVRTWFHAVHPATYPFHVATLSALLGSAASRTLFRGTLNAMVTKNVPARYARLPASTYPAPGRSHASSDRAASAAHAAAVPRNVPRNSGLITTRLIDCMAAIP